MVFAFSLWKVPVNVPVCALIIGDPTSSNLYLPSCWLVLAAISHQ
jgi:hypothetical protein